MPLCVDRVKLAAQTYAKGIVGYTETPVVSSDFIGESRSTVFDASAGVMLSPTFVKLVSWYDNEWGYSSRLCDLISIMATRDGCFDDWWTWMAEEGDKGDSCASAPAEKMAGSQSADSVISSLVHQMAMDDAFEMGMQDGFGSEDVVPVN